MKKIILLVSSLMTLNAQTYYSQIEPQDVYSVKSDIFGKVVSVNLDMENTQIDKKQVLIKIDTIQDENNLQKLTKEFELYTKLLEIKNNIFEKYSASTYKSNITKDTALYEVINLDIKILNIQNQIKNLKDTIKRKTVYANPSFISKINTKKGDYIKSGSLLYSYFNPELKQITLYVFEEDNKNIDSKKLFINGVENEDFSIYSKSIIKDNKNISTYKIELFFKDTKNKYQYGKITSVEFK